MSIHRHYHPGRSAPKSRKSRLQGLSGLLAALTLCFIPVASAESTVIAATAGQRAAARMDIYVRIPELLRMRLMQHGEVLRITEEDIRRGWIDTALTVEITSNARTGFALQLKAHPVLATGGVVEGLGAPVTLNNGAGQVRLTHHGQPEKTRLYPLQIRLALAPGAVPGVYAHPLGVLLSS
jgi:hypothetical protein